MFSKIVSEVLELEMDNIKFFLFIFMIPLFWEYFNNISEIGDHIGGISVFTAAFCMICLLIGNQKAVILKITFYLFMALIVGDYILTNPKGIWVIIIVLAIFVFTFIGGILVIAFRYLYTKIHKDPFDSLPPEEAARLNALIDETVQKISLEMEAEERAKKHLEQELAQKKNEK